MISAVTSTYIGLRTYRKNPVTTRRLGGITGAGVPRPCNAKRANESSKMGNPATIRAAPSTRAIGNSGGAKCQCVRFQGTYTASVPGAMTRNIAEPMIAAARCTIGAYSTPPRIVRIGRALASRDVLREVLVAFELCQAGRPQQCLRTALMSPTIYVTIICFCPSRLGFVTEHPGWILR